MQPGDSIELDITGTAHGGVFIGRHDGRVVFVPDALPGERVRVALTDVGKQSFWRGEALEILDASPHRRPHIWRQADIDVEPSRRPGGADFGHIALEHQRVLKEDVARDSLVRFGGMAADDARVTGLVAEAVPGEAADGTGWRTRVSLHVDDTGAIGPVAARSHRVVPVTDLPLAAPDVESAALRLSHGKPGRLDLVLPADGRVRVIPRLDTRSGARRGRRPARAAEPARTDPAREVVIEKVAGREFRVDAGGFWQVHRGAADMLTTVVAESLRALRPDEQAIDPDAWHLDLYGGAGLFAATLGELGGAQTRVTSVESDARSTDHAAENLTEWVGARVETERVDRYIARLSAEASASERERLSRGVVLLDPPRAGAGRAVVEGIASLRPETVVYVACDPVALARDLATFRAAGYDTASLRLLDLFPNSHHMEAVATLTRG